MATKKTFTEIRGGIKLDISGIIVEIKKVRKDGTKREFFRVTYEGKSVSSTLWARLYDAKRIAKAFASTKLS